MSFGNELKKHPIILVLITIYVVIALPGFSKEIFFNLTSDPVKESVYAKDEWVALFLERIENRAKGKMFLGGVQQGAPCNLIQDNWQNGQFIEESLIQIDQKMAAINAKYVSHLNRGEGYRNDPYIVYYFKPLSQTRPLEEIKQQAFEVFKQEGVNWTYTSLKTPTGTTSRPRVTIKDQYITLSFSLKLSKDQIHYKEIQKFSSEGEYREPPDRIKRAAQKAGLEFLYSERRDLFSYNYTYDIRSFWQKALRINWYVSIFLKFDAAVAEHGVLKDVQLVSAGCKWPKAWAPGFQGGLPPSYTITKAPYPNLSWPNKHTRTELVKSGKIEKPSEFAIEDDEMFSGINEVTK